MAHGEPCHGHSNNSFCFPLYSQTSLLYLFGVRPSGRIITFRVYLLLYFVFLFFHSSLKRASNHSLNVSIGLNHFSLLQVIAFSQPQVLYHIHNVYALCFRCFIFAPSLRIIFLRRNMDKCELALHFLLAISHLKILGLAFGFHGMPHEPYLQISLYYLYLPQKLSPCNTLRFSSFPLHL